MAGGPHAVSRAPGPASRSGLACGASLLYADFGSNYASMEYRDVRYTVRVGIERDQWCVAIHPHGVEVPVKRISGTREEAERLAHSMINGWLKRQRAKISSQMT